MGQQSTILRKILNSNRAKKGPWKNFPIYFLAIWIFFQAVKGFWPCIFFWPLPWFVAKQLFLAGLKDIERKLVVSCTPSTELQKRANRANQLVLFFLAGANFWEKHAKNRRKQAKTRENTQKQAKNMQFFGANFFGRC